MGKQQHWKRNLVTALELPDDLAYKESIVTLIGPNQAIIENYRSIQRYTREEITIVTLRGKLTICGKNLEIPCYMPEEMKVCGRICSISLERR